MMKLCILYTCGLVHCPVCVSHIVHSENVTGSVSQVETAYTDCEHMIRAICSAWPRLEQKVQNIYNRLSFVQASFLLGNYSFGQVDSHSMDTCALVL